ncbi:hypothetical protein HP532_00245 [Pseudomonas sp. CrR25]|nr:hypothetical protein [Pseudomonas sp. CrR25]
MLTGLAPLHPSLPTSGSPSSPSSAAEVRGYLDFQLLLSRLLPGPLALEAPANADSTQPQAPESAEPDPEHGRFIARLQLELGERLKANPRRVDPLSLALLADACEACSRIAPTRQPLELPPGGS